MSYRGRRSTLSRVCWSLLVTSAALTAIGPHQSTTEGAAQVAIPRRRSTIQRSEGKNPGVLTYHNDWGRTGQSLRETVLAPATVNPRQFGLLRTDFRVDGDIRAQPLYLPGVAVGGSSCNLVIVVTEHDSVYAFDADVDRHPQNWASPLWVRTLLDGDATPVPTEDQVDDDVDDVAVRDGMLLHQPVSMSADSFAWPGVTPSVSANGDTDGIVWAVASSDVPGVSAVLYAFDAGDLSQVLYKSSGGGEDIRAGVTAPDGRDAMTPVSAPFVIF